MTTSTIERAYLLARSGQVPDLLRLKQRLKADGCRAVDALLAPRAIRGHLEAICSATYQAAAADRAAQPELATLED
jgi:hypothetical protein